MKVTFAMIGLVGVYLFYRAAIAVLRREHPPLLLAFALVPSVMFWSSILGKDPIVFLGVALYVFGVVKWRYSSRLSFLLIAASGIGLAMLMRTWVAAILSLPLAYLFAKSSRTPARRLVMGSVATAIASLTAVVSSVAILSKVTRGAPIANREELVEHTHSVLRGFSPGTTAMASELSISSLPIMLLVLPLGVFTVLFRPLPGEILNPFGLIAGLENLVFLSMFVSGVRALRRDRQLRRRMFDEPVFVWATLLTLTWSAAYGLVSMQNLGASVRFRLPIMMVFFALLLWVRFAREQVATTRLASRRQTAPPATALPQLASAGLSHT
jgi:hypothetical protein